MAIDSSRGRKAVQLTSQALSRDPRLSPQKNAQKRKQRRVLYATGAALLSMSGIGYGIYYWASAPERAHAALALGLREMAPGSYAAAIKQFTRAASISPALPDAYLNRGIALHNLGQSERAVTDLEQALALDPALTSAHNELGQIYSERGDTRKALEHLSQSVQVQPTANGYYQRGQLYEKLGEHEKAVQDYDLAIAELNAAPYVYFSRATAKANMGDMAGAQSDRARALELATETGRVP